jgi:hypothetical protein
MRWLLDTNLVIDAFAGRSEAVKAIESARTSEVEWIGYSAITRLEVLGFPWTGRGGRGWAAPVARSIQRSRG